MKPMHRMSLTVAFAVGRLDCPRLRCFSMYKSVVHIQRLVVQLAHAAIPEVTRRRATT